MSNNKNKTYFKREKYDYQVNDNIIQTVQYLTDNTSYQRWGVQKLSDKLDQSIPHIKSALAILKQCDDDEIERMILSSENVHSQSESSDTTSGYAEYDYKKDETYTTEFEQFIDRNKIDENQISQVYYKEQANDKVRFTIQTKSNSSEQLDDDRLYNFLSTSDFTLPPVDHSYTSTNTVSVLNIYDAHIDKLSHTGPGGIAEMNSNLDLLKQKFSELFADIKQDQPQTIIFPVGSDFFNTNGSERETKNGTPQQMTVHWQDSFQAGIEFYCSIIREMIQFCNVHLVDISGNHDADKVFYLSQVLKAYFRNDVRVKCQFSKDNRKYIYVNDVLMGFQHGDISKKKINKLPNVMAIEQAKHWGSAKYRLWLLGDIHHREKYTTYSTLEDSGVHIEFLRPATSADTWHHDQMWIGSKKSISAFSFINGSAKKRTHEIIF